MGLIARLRRTARQRLRRVYRRHVRTVPRRSRKLARIVVTAAETTLAAEADRRSDHRRALGLLADAARRSPADMRVARLNSQVLARTGRLQESLAEASRLAIGTDTPRNTTLQRVVQGRWTETDPAWRPVVPGRPPEAAPLPGRVLYLAKESMPHRNNGYCTRTHETLLAVRGAGRVPTAVTLPGFPAEVPDTASDVDEIRYDHVMPGAAGLLGQLSWEEYVQVTTTAFAREVARVRPEVLHAGSGHRGFDLGLVGQALSDWAGLPWIYEVRSFFETTWTADQRYAESAEYYERRFATETRVMGAADAVVTLSGPMRDEIVHAHGIDPGRVFVVPNAVDLERFTIRPRDAALRSSLGLGTSFVLGYVSNLDHYREGQEVLIRACSLLRGQGLDVAVVLVGDGRRRPELEALAAELAISEHCVFTGSVPFDEVPDWYAQIDLFVVPRVPERAGRMVSPMKPFEAMAMRVPVMVSDLPALVEIAGPAEERAFVFTAGEPAALAARVRDLMATPSALTARADAALEWVRRERTWSANGAAFDRIYAFAAEQHAKRVASC